MKKLILILSIFAPLLLARAESLTLFDLSIECEQCEQISENACSFRENGELVVESCRRLLRRHLRNQLEARVEINSETKPSLREVYQFLRSSPEDKDLAQLAFELLLHSKADRTVLVENLELFVNNDWETFLRALENYWPHADNSFRRHLWDAPLSERQLRVLRAWLMVKTEVYSEENLFVELSSSSLPQALRELANYEALVEEFGTQQAPSLFSETLALANNCFYPENIGKQDLISLLQSCKQSSQSYPRAIKTFFLDSLSTVLLNQYKTGYIDEELLIRGFDAITRTEQGQSPALTPVALMSIYSAIDELPDRTLENFLNEGLPLISKLEHSYAPLSARLESIRSAEEPIEAMYIIREGFKYLPLVITAGLVLVISVIKIKNFYLISAKHKEKVQVFSYFGLSLECSKQDLKAEYHRLLKLKHPDAGASDPRGFAQLQRKYEQAREYFV